MTFFKFVKEVVCVLILAIEVRSFYVGVYALNKFLHFQVLKNLCLLLVINVLR
jgi:hypothetical protein